MFLTLQSGHFHYPCLFSDLHVLKYVLRWHAIFIYFTDLFKCHICNVYTDAAFNQIHFYTFHCTGFYPKWLTIWYFQGYTFHQFMCYLEIKLFLWFVKQSYRNAFDCAQNTNRKHKALIRDKTKPALTL